MLLVSLLIVAAVLFTKLGSKLGAPSLLLFLLLGMAAGPDGFGLEIKDFHIAETFGHFAMAVILFSAGLETSWKETRPIFGKSIMLSTVGVTLTMLITGLFIYYVLGGMIGGVTASITGCFLVAAILSATDSTSVFSILRGKRLNLRENLGPMLELESGSNDPMANILTVTLVGILSSPSYESHWQVFGITAFNLLLQVGVGFAVGLAIGWAGKLLLGKIKLDNSSLYSILVLSVGMTANGLASTLHGHALLAVYVAAIFIGNKAKLAYRHDVLKFFDGVTWMVQLMMFLMLGLLARPSTMGKVLVPALLIGLFLMIVARPSSVFISMLPFRGMSTKAKVLVSWVGLKGAGPILCALCTVVAGIEGSGEVFNIVFLISLLSLFMQGFSFPPLSAALHLSYDRDPEVQTFGMDLPDEMGMLRDHTVTADDLLGGGTLRDLHLPHGIRVMMVRRDGRFLIPHGSMKLMEGDNLIIVMGESDD